SCATVRGAATARLVTAGAMLAARAVKAAAERNVRRFTAALRTEMAAVRRAAAGWGEVRPAEGSGHGRPRLDGALGAAAWSRSPEGSHFPFFHFSAAECSPRPTVSSRRHGRIRPRSSSQQAGNYGLLRGKVNPPGPPL